MNEQAPKGRKICPLLSINRLAPINCMMDDCTWFYLEYHADGDYTTGACALLRIADRLGKEKAAPGAANAQNGKEAPETTNLTESALIVQGERKDCQV